MSKRKPRFVEIDIDLTQEELDNIELAVELGKFKDINEFVDEALRVMLAGYEASEKLRKKFERKRMRRK